MSAWLSPDTLYVAQDSALLAADYTVVLPDLRGYGDSGKPDTDAEHSPYSKRKMAQDMAQIMWHGLAISIMVVIAMTGADALPTGWHDYREPAAALAVLDIAPTLDMYEATDMRFAMSYYHWFFLTQPAPLPEQLIGADAEFYLEKTWPLGQDARRTYARGVAEYKRCFASQPPFMQVAKITCGGKHRS